MNSNDDTTTAFDKIAKSAFEKELKISYDILVKHGGARAVLDRVHRDSKAELAETSAISFNASHLFRDGVMAAASSSVEPIVLKNFKFGSLILRQETDGRLVLDFRIELVLVSPAKLLRFELSFPSKLRSTVVIGFVGISPDPRDKRYGNARIFIDALFDEQVLKEDLLRQNCEIMNVEPREQIAASDRVAAERSLIGCDHYGSSLILKDEIEKLLSDVD